MATAARPYLTMVKGKPKMMEYTPGSAVTAGDVFVTNGLPCVAHVDIAASALGEVAIGGGIYSGMADGAISVGNEVYWDNSAFKFTLTAAGNSHFGTLLAGPTADMVGTGPAADGDTCYVLHNPQHIGAGITPIGYVAGSGGAVTQATNKSTGVTLNKLTGAITMNNANLTTLTPVGFTLTNSTIAATDTVVVSIKSGATANSYLVGVDAVAAGSCHITLFNTSAGTLGEAVVINFAVIKGAAS